MKRISAFYSWTILLIVGTNDSYFIQIVEQKKVLDCERVCGKTRLASSVFWWTVVVFVAINKNRSKHFTLW